MKAYEHIQKFQVKYCDVDFKDELKPSVALSLMEEVACSSADELGFGYAYVKPKGYAFMVTNVCCSFLRPIGIGELITVKTWPLPPSYVVFGREYKFLSQAGEALINASSRWCLVDMKTGRLLQSKVIENQDYSTYNTAKALEEVRWKIPAFKPEEGSLRFTITIANSEYDHNMHVNNTRYADYCFNCFTVAELAERKLKRFSISYVKQCKENDTLRFYLKKAEDGSYLAHGFNEKDEIVVQSQIAFDE
ncbi:MAG: hypothetical protein IJ514_00680 [Clostridia bacterium]|nr:hypothetical protein [Clostridia bacterium]